MAEVYYKGIRVKKIRECVKPFVLGALIILSSPIWLPLVGAGVIIYAIYSLGDFILNGEY